MKAFFKKLKDPPVWGVAIAILSALLFLAACVTSFIFGFPNGFPKWCPYVLYTLSALFVAYTVYLFVKKIPWMRKLFIRILCLHPTGKRWIESYGFRAVVFAGISAVINMGYVVFHGVLAIVSRSNWYASLALYYIFLTFLRSRIVIYHLRLERRSVRDKKWERKEEIRKYAFSGFMLVALPVFLSVMIVQTILMGGEFVHWEWTVYAVGAYTLYKIVKSIYSMVKARKNRHMTVRALSCVSLADAMVSILVLQTTVLATFASIKMSGAINAVTGGAICAFTVMLGVSMLMTAAREKEKDNEADRAEKEKREDKENRENREEQKSEEERAHE